jgi:hypothetical protein
MAASGSSWVSPYAHRLLSHVSKSRVVGDSVPSEPEGLSSMALDISQLFGIGEMGAKGMGWDATLFPEVVIQFDC